jgi:homoserine kinase type II
LTGLFDFYFAGVDTWLFDIAVCLNDWCVELQTGQADVPRSRALLRAYTGVRPLTGPERALLPAMARAGALRFWISRLWDYHLPREASVLKPHDPGHFERVLRQRVTAPVTMRTATTEHPQEMTSSFPPPGVKQSGKATFT